MLDDVNVFTIAPSGIFAFPNDTIPSYSPVVAVVAIVVEPDPVEPEVVTADCDRDQIRRSLVFGDEAGQLAEFGLRLAVDRLI